MAKIKEQLFVSKSNLEFIIRSVEGRDAEQFGRFQNKIASETQNTLRYVGQPEVDLEKTKKNWDETLNNPNIVKIGTFHKGELVGYVFCHKPIADHPWMQHLGYFAMMIVQDFWGQGLGHRLLEVLDEYVAQGGITKMEATVRTNNPRAFELYKRAGYIIEGTRQKAAFIDGKYLDEYFIAKFY